MTLNTRALKLLAKTIKEADRFDLSEWGARKGTLRSVRNAAEVYNDCNTVGCVAGWQNAIWNVDNPNEPPRHPSWASLAAQDLGLTIEQAYQLFHGGDVWRNVIPQRRSAFSATAAEAAKLLEGLANGTYEFGVPGQYH